VEAARAGRFHIYAARHVDQASALLTGLIAGRADVHEQYPPDSLNGRVQARLKELARLRQAYSNRNGNHAAP
jgi:hypothetical protein